MQSTLNSFFNFEDIPQYYFYVLNFGPFIQMDDFIHLKQATCLTGPNGSGKSSLMDAIKTAIIVNQRYLSFNPKSGKNVELQDYLNLFGLHEKIGPTLLIFSIIFPNKKLGYDRAIFGVGWDKDTNGKYFYKENMSKEEVLPIIKKAGNLALFFKEIEKMEYPGKLHGPWIEVNKYHKFLDQNGIFFFFPYGYDDLKSYREFLKLLRDCSNTLTSTSVLDPNQLKKDLFKPHKGRDELISSFDKIERGMKNYKDFHNKREKQREQMVNINEIIENYKSFYLNNIIERIAHKIKVIDDQIQTNSKEKRRNDNEINKIQTELSEKQVKMDNNLRILKEKEEKYSFLSELHKSSQNCQNYYFKNQKFINLDLEKQTKEKTDLENDISEESNRIERLKNKCLNMQKKLKNKEEKYEELKSSRAANIHRMKILSQTKTELIKERDIQNKIKDEIEEIIKSRDLVDKSLENNANSLLDLGISNFSDLEIKISKIKDQINLNIREIALIDEEVKNLEENSNSKKLSKKSIDLEIKTKYQLKRLYEYFNNENLLKLRSIEPILEEFKDYFIVPYQKRNIYDELKQAVIDSNADINFIMLEETDDIDQFFTSTPITENYHISTLFAKNLIKFSKSINTPKFFGRNSLEKYIKAKNQKKQDHEKKKESLEKNLGPFNQINFENTSLSSNKEKILQKLSSKTGNVDYHIFIDKKKSEIQLLDTHLEKINMELSQIPIDKKFNESIGDLERDIKEINQDIVEKREEIEEKLKEREKLKLRQLEISEIIENSPNIEKSFKLLFEELVSNLISSEFFEFNPEININSEYFLVFQFVNEKVLPKHREYFEDIVKLEESNKFLVEKISEKNLKLEDLKLIRKELNLKLTNLENEKQEIIQNGLKLLTRRLYLEIKIEENIEEIYNKNLEIEMQKICESGKNPYSYQFNFFKEWDAKIRKTCELFNVNPDVIVSRDNTGNVLLTKLFEHLNLGVNSIEIKTHLLEKIRDLDDELEKTWNGFTAEVSSFLTLILSEIRDFKRTAKKYNEISKKCNFGSLENISIEISYKDQFKALKEFRDELVEAKDKMRSNEWFLDLISNESNFLTEYFSKRIFNDPNANPEDFLDINNYYYLEVFNIGLNGKRRPALSSSGGESTGIKFMIYALAFHNLRSKSLTINSLTYAKPIFIYFDEAASVDDKGIYSVMNLAEELKINAVIGMVNAPSIHDKRLIDYILINGVVSPATSEIISEIEFGEIPEDN